MDHTAANEFLTEFVDIAEDFESSAPSHEHLFYEQLMARGSVVRAIADQVAPRRDWDRSDVHQHIAAAREAVFLIRDRDRIKLIIPFSGPQMHADDLHPTVWDAARSFWHSEHRREAVAAAARSVKAQLEHKLGRRDATSETSLVKESFSTNRATPGQPRLRLMADDSSPTFRSLHGGIAEFASGCYRSLRNPTAHEHYVDEIPEQIAFEQLAAFSMLARWIDDATVERAS